MWGGGAPRGVVYQVLVCVVWCWAFPLRLLQLWCAGRSFPWLFPPWLMGCRWSAVKESGWCGGSVVSIGSPHIQQVGFGFCWRSLARFFR